MARPAYWRQSADSMQPYINISRLFFTDRKKTNVTAFENFAYKWLPKLQESAAIN